MLLSTIHVSCLQSINLQQNILDILFLLFSYRQIVVHCLVIDLDKVCLHKDVFKDGFFCLVFQCTHEQCISVYIV
jgi:hypothetical protein